MNSPRTLAVGDVHGCSIALDALLNFIELRPDDTLIFLGDYVDRGPDSRGVLERLVELSARPNTPFLRGNHDLWMERAREDRQWFVSWLRGGVGGLATLHSYGDFKNIPASHWRFLEELADYHETADEIFVHGAVDAAARMCDQREQTLLWERVNDQAPHFSGKRVICGHTSQTSGWPLDKGFAVCIDTFCCGGGWLSALDATTDRVWQTNQAGQTRLIQL